MSNLTFYLFTFFIYREQALLNARSAPILGRQRDMEAEKVHYPHVYDSQAKARETSAFIAGAKVCHCNITTYGNRYFLRKCLHRFFLCPWLYYRWIQYAKLYVKIIGKWNIAVYLLSSWNIFKFVLYFNKFKYGQYLEHIHVFDYFSLYLWIVSIVLLTG